MTEKEKAKAYDEAIERTKKLYSNGIAEEIFPELKESEDEKIRKEIISILRNAYWTSNRNRFNKLVAWLEKQGKKSADKVEPKFKVGDWITFYGGNPFKILKIEAEMNGVLDYLLLGQNGYDYYFNKTYIDENARLWTIQDAKDGDVLVSKYNQPFIYNGKYNNYKVGAYCGIKCTGKHFIKSIYTEDACWTNNEFIKPATKEQRDVLMEAMNDVGYKWDAEKKELKEEKVK